jgi:acyl carrier protein
MNDQELTEKLHACIAQTIGIEAEKVTPDASLIDDLGADSLDLLDLVFRLEQAFQIRISRGDIERRAKETLPEEDFEQDGLLTPSAKDALRRELPEIPAERFEAVSRPSDIPRLFTARTFLRLVKKQMEAARAA